MTTATVEGLMKLADEYAQDACKASDHGYGISLEMPSRVAVEACARALAAPADSAPVEAPNGWLTVHTVGLQPLVDALDRADGKGYLPDAIAPAWQAFTFTEAGAAAPRAPAPADSAPVADASDFETAKRVVPGWKRLQEMLADLGYDTSDTAKRHALRALLLMYAIDALKAAPRTPAPADSAPLTDDTERAEFQKFLDANGELTRLGVASFAWCAWRARGVLVAAAPRPADSAPVAWLHHFRRVPSGGRYEEACVSDQPQMPKEGYRFVKTEPLYAAAPRAPAPTPAPTNIKQQIFEAAVVAHGVRFAQKLPRPDIPSLEAIWVGVDKALAAPRAPAPDAELEIPDKPKLLRDFLAIAIEEWGHYPENTNGRKWVGAAQAAIAAAPAPDAGTEALRDALEIGLDLATAEAAKARELYGSYPKDGLGRKCVAADADVATIERALAALGAADQGEAVMAWIPVSAGLPAPNVLCLVAWCGRIDIASRRWKPKGDWLWGGHPGSHNDVTHWMPLPASPALSAADQGAKT